MEAPAGETTARWMRLKALFSQAIELTPDGRQAWIDRNCAGDPELRAELDALIAAHHRAGTFLEGAALDSPQAAEAVFNATSRGPGLDSMPPRFGAYRILRELDRGGMGVVYLAARDDESFEKLVAIKVVPGDLIHPEVLQRFHGERRILATLDHPNIAHLLDAGATDAGVPYVVMEYVEGEPITVYCAARRLPVRERLKLFCAVAEAVQYSHQRLVIHRDIKARNILVTRDGVPKLLDFGIAKLVQPSPLEDDRTRTAFRALTPESASPEQIRGEPVTVATDVYSLGTLLYRLLTDRSPYRGDMTTEAGMVQAVCHEEPVRPSERLAGDTGSPATGATPFPIDRRELSGDLDWIVLKALRKEPARRYGSVEQFAQDIQRHLSHRPILAAPDAWTYRARKFLARHRVGVAAAATVLAATLTATAVSVWQARVAQRERGAAQQRFDMVRKLARAVVFDFNDALESVPGAIAGRKLIIGTAIEYLNALSAGELADVGLMREVAAAYLKIGDIQGNPTVPNLNDPEGSRASYEHALSLYRRLAARAPSAETDSGMAQAHWALGVADWAKGDSTAALGHYAEMRRLSEGLAKSAPANPAYRRDVARADYQIGQVYLMLGDSERAAENYRLSVAAAESIVLVDPRDQVAWRTVGVGYLKLGDVAVLRQDHALAMSWFRRALEVFAEMKRQPSVLPGTVRLTVYARLRMSEVLRYSDPRAAEATIRTVLPQLEATSGADQMNAQARFDLGYAYSLLGTMITGQHRPAEGARVIQTAVDHYRRGLAANPGYTDARRDLGLSLFSLCTAHLEDRQFTAAIASCQEALRLLEAPDIQAREKSEIASTYQTLGDAHAGLARAGADERIRTEARAAASQAYRTSVSAWAALAASRPLSARELASQQKAIRGDAGK
jgi:non-specific serine/threonine protein kinase/serine/threonine-protein kinase